MREVRRANQYTNPHGMSQTRIYRIYKNMKQRCNNKNTIKYHIYGGKGIKCEWNTFEDFYADMGLSYKKHERKCGSENTTIDRIDSSRNYSKENCRWATYRQQALNRNNNHMITYNKVTKSLSEWAHFTGIKISTLSMRLNTYNWSIEKALTKGAIQ